MNVIDNLHSGRFLKSYVNTIQRTFPYVYVLRDHARWLDASRYTYAVAASFRPLSPSALESANIELGRGQPVARFMPQDVFAAWLGSQRNVLLTDDYAPVDNMLASVLLKTDSMRETVRHFRSGEELDARDELQGAIDEYSEALRLNPWHIPSHMSRGRAYVRLRQFEPAILDFGEAIRLDPEHAPAYGNRAFAYGQLDMHTKAQQDFNQALDLGYSPALLKETFDGLSANLR